MTTCSFFGGAGAGQERGRQGQTRRQKLQDGHFETEVSQNAKNDNLQLFKVRGQGGRGQGQGVGSGERARAGGQGGGRTGVLDYCFRGLGGV